MHTDEQHADRFPGVSVKANEGTAPAKDKERCCVEDQGNEGQGGRDQHQSYHLSRAVMVYIYKKSIQGKA